MARKFKYKVFLSHNRKQKKWVREFSKQLRALGIRVFFDEDSIDPGEEIVTAIEQGIESSRYIVLILTPSSLASSWVAMETALTIYCDPDAAKKRLIPVMLETVQRKNIRLTVRRLNIIDLTKPKTRKERYSFLLKHLGIPESQIPSPLPWPKKYKSKLQKPKQLAKSRTSERKKLTSIIITKDGKEMIFIKGSRFLMGSNKEPESTDDFYIDKYPVTNKEYKEFIDSTRRRAPRGWKALKYQEHKSNHPVSGVSFSEAKAYAQWAGNRLPTEKEWEKAARGTNGREYPWGNKFDSKNCNTIESKINDTTPVTQYPNGASPFSVMDMVGNVWEWIDDWSKIKDKETHKIIKGGCYRLDQGFALCANSDSYSPSSGRNTTVGFRCAKNTN